MVLGDQLSASLSSLAAADRQHDRVVMAEVREEAGYVPHHPKKIIFLFSAMRHFAAQLREQGWQVDYYGYDAGLDSLCDALQRSAETHQTSEILITRPVEWRLDQQMRDQWPSQLGMSIRLLEDNRFLCSHASFQQ